MGFFFKRLETYTEVAPTEAMTDIITEILVEVLTIFGIATKEIRRGPTSECPNGCMPNVTDSCVGKFLKKLAGKSDLEDALKKLDRLTQEEARMALAELLKVTHGVRGDVKVIDGKVEDIGEDICDKVQGVNEKVQVVIDGARGMSSHSPIPSKIITFRCQGSELDYPTDGKQCKRSQVFVISYLGCCTLLVLRLIHRESVKTAPTSVALSRRSVHKSQHCSKGSTQGHDGVALSRKGSRRMEVYWLPIVDPRKTCVSICIFRAHAISPTLIFIAGSGKSVIWYVVYHLLRVGTHSSPVPPLFKTLWPYAKPDQPSWPISTSILGISASKPVTTCSFLSYPNLLLALALAATFSTAFIRHTKTAFDSPATTL